MELRHLRAFCAVAQEMQVTKAAKRLNLPQPALTQQIRLLERDLGQRLVRPKGRGIELTPAGTYFHREAEALLLNLHNVCLKANEIGRGESGHLRVGLTEGASFNPSLAAVLASFRDQWPIVSLSFTQRQTPELAGDLRNNLIDVVCMCPLPRSEALTQEPMYAEDMLVAIPAEHRLACQDVIGVDDLVDVPLFLVSHGYTEHSLETSLGKACKRRGFVPRVAQTVPEFMLALNLVAAGLGVSFVPPYMNNIHTAKIVYRRVVPAAGVTMETVLAWRSEDESAMVRNFCSVARCSFAQSQVTVASHPQGISGCIPLPD